MCGARPGGALRSSARRWLTPKRCCSSTTATARRSNSTGSSMIACVPTSSFSSPRRQLAEQVGAAARGRRAGQQRGLDELARHQLLQRREVLLGERLGRRHQRGLGAGLDRAQHRVERDDGLAGADLAHQQPLHRPVAGDVVVDRRHRRALVAGRRERQRVGQPARGQRARRVQGRGARGLAAARAAAEERDLQQQELVERQPPAAALLVAEVGGVERGPAVGQPQTRRAGGPGAAPARRARSRGARARAPRSAPTSARPRPGRSPCPRRSTTSSPVSACSLTRKPRWPWYLPVSSSRVPGR